MQMWFVRYSTVLVLLTCLAPKDVKEREVY
jgi:hypothetical protein